MSTSYHLDVNRRHDFVILFDCSYGNPNGDPDNNNQPRIDPQTLQGLVSDVAIKRKVRDWVDAMVGQQARYKIYVEAGVALNAQHRRAYEALNLDATGTKQDPADVEQAKKWLCQNFFDIRVFGAVMTTGINSGQVKGPVQFKFAHSIDPVVPMEITITRVAVTREEDLPRAVEGKDGKTLIRGKDRDIGKKFVVPYGLYWMHGFFNPFFAKKTGVTEEDLTVFWKALQSLWDFDASAARKLDLQGLYVFSHESAFGNAPANQLFNRVKVAKLPEIVAPRGIEDYQISIEEEGLPAEVNLTRLVG
jgi:CRISPR-associated protein Csd2